MHHALSSARFPLSSLTFSILVDLAFLLMGLSIALETATSEATLSIDDGLESPAVAPAAVDAMLPKEGAQGQEVNAKIEISD